ncbi:MAG: proton-conducting transporter membrane subunit [Anaerolineales bacterium]|jgi:multicomponent Na+:H+ antiporter subunit D|nr:proton-conducting transporter membrane subunit [Anaerolineales bacterium]
MDWLILPPLLLPFGGVVATLLARKNRSLQPWLALSVMLTSLGFSLALAGQVFLGGETFALQAGLWPVPAGITLIADPLSAFMLVMTQLVLSAGLLYATGSQEKVVQYPTFYPIFLGLAAGMSGAFLAGDLFNLFVFAELIVISGAVLTGMADDKYGVEAAYKYLLISTLGAILFLLGIGSLYAAHGTLNLAGLAESLAENPSAPLSLAGLAFLSATFLTKSAIFPFHFWQPDFHAAAPTAVSAMLSSIVVKFGVYGFLRLTTLLFIEQAELIREMLLILGVIGVIYGGFGAAGTHNLKRMLAYSTLSQIGFILVGIGWGTPLALAAALVFTFNHALIKSALLMLAGALASRAPVKSASFEVLAGVGQTSPAAGILFLLGGMALAGIPPLNGFVSKLMIFLSGVQSQNYLSLALIGVASLVSLVYVIRAFMKIWFEPNPALKPKRGDLLLAPALLVLVCLALGIWSEPLLLVAEQVSQSLLQPENYIQIVNGLR